MKYFILADDLSGGVESAATLLKPDKHVNVLLDGPVGISLRDNEAVVFDLNTRHGSEASAQHKFRRVAKQISRTSSVSPTCIIKKSDSLLRGHWGVEVKELMGGTGGFAVAAFALPELARATSGGRVFVEGVPLNETSLWRAESLPPPKFIGDVFPGKVTPIRHESSREQSQIVAEVARNREMAVADVSTQSDVASIIETALPYIRPGRPLILVGTSALCAQFANLIRETPRRTRSNKPEARATHHPLIVMGSASEAAVKQVDELLKRDVNDFPVGPETDIVEISESLSRTLRISPVVLRVDPTLNFDHCTSQRLAHIISQVTARASKSSHLFLSGGETARMCLDVLGINRLQLIQELEPGCVLSDAYGAENRAISRRVITRPGSFGERESLVRCLNALYRYSSPN